MDNWPKVAIIILNWNGWQDTIECLESSQRLMYSNYQVIVIDNGSTDGSLEKVKAWASGGISTESKFFRYNPDKKPVYWIEYDRATAEAGGTLEHEAKINNLPSNRRLILIENKENLGFAGGNNVGLRYALNKNFDYIFLLNNDAIVTSKTLQELIKIMTAHPQFGVATPKIYYYDEPHRIWNCGGRLTITGSRKYNNQNKINTKKNNKAHFTCITFATGCALLIRTSIIKNFGLLSEEFFLGEEDYEFSVRMKKHKVKMICVNKAHVYHKISQSFKKFYPEKLSFAFIHHLNRFINMKNNYHPLYWHFWRFGAICYILPMLYIRHHENINSLIRYSKKLIACSNRYTQVSREIVLKIQKEGI